MNAPPGTDWRPALAPAIVRRHDPVRDADLLLLPERVGVLTGSAGAVVGLCDGTRRVGDIVEELAARFPDAPVATDVPLFLERLRTEGWLR
ncbi:pyrroloquinoline quinone biosynthesis peptide chaperone PqqD [Streptomyces sp. uw30]|uniref:pyrroloquinoline quinone biosynthesis peptide chaperone PqqD n=1 Tax=unclassified Streptomyces TaxID=2593676 RepID=UPI0011CD8581|nr:pyrroloquinoline quinone biosynthesis peptide chaperone PqqD [Streptomyces sp. uw30]TXS50614.1 pyrroloquinoline quinone biosynthesis peptide chaperone PqqD [Streptomyces sp. uw30]WSU52141.1 pyrroloquinoline quinone biosynthesis peptide chaperone PqqD [Streptomyces sp. NBC_01092]